MGFIWNGLTSFDLEEDDDDPNMEKVAMQYLAKLYLKNKFWYGKKLSSKQYTADDNSQQKAVLIFQGRWYIK